jgi:hypothetical protein
MEIIIAVVVVALAVLVIRGLKSQEKYVIEPVIEPVVEQAVAEVSATEIPVEETAPVKKTRKPRTPKTPAVVKKAPAKKADVKSTAKITAGRKPKAK